MLKTFLIFTLFVSSAFAHEVNEISGTFFLENGQDQEMKKQETHVVDIYSVNTFVHESGISRLPSSIAREDDLSVTELTGTFE